MSEKIVGYILLAIGIIVITVSCVNVYLVFTKDIKPVQLFNLPAPQIDLGVLVQNSLPDQFAGILDSGNSNQKSSKQEILSAAIINEPMNITAHLFLMGFIASAGYKLASLGVMMIRPIVVKLKGEKIVEKQVQN